MGIDAGRVSEQLNLIWDRYGYAVLAGVALLLLVGGAATVVAVIRSRQRDRWVAGVTALVVLAWTSEGLWEVAYLTLGLPLAFAAMTFFVYEAMMVTSALQAERHRRRHGTPGPAGRYVWALATVTASVVALNASTLVEAVLRFTLPLAAAGLWWVSITAERDGEPPAVLARRRALAARREATWAVTPRTVLVSLGVMRPGTETITEAERERRIRLMVIAADRLHWLPASSRRARRVSARLRKHARLATAADVTEVKERVERTTRIAELVMPGRATTPGSVVRAADQPSGAISAGGADQPASGLVPPVKVPTSAWRTSQWIETWMRMCSDGDLVMGPINDDRHARANYGASARHLKNIRRAAASGALRTRARELGVPLPDNYVDDPAPVRRNGKARASR